MVKGQDVLVLLTLSNDREGSSVRSIGEPLGLDPAAVHRALRRLEQAGLIDNRRRVSRSSAEEYFLHAWKYAFPVKQMGPTRGVPTAWAAAPLKDLLAISNDDPPPVWPYAKGKVRGIALEPIHDNVPEVALRDSLIAEQLALLDAIRLGDARIREVASKELVKRLKNEDHEP